MAQSSGYGTYVLATATFDPIGIIPEGERGYAVGYRGSQGCDRDYAW